MNSIEIKNLCKRYDSFSLKNVCFDVPKGYITGFIGQNGAGKTTTIKAIIKAIVNYTGSIKVLDKDVEEVIEEIGVVMDNIFYPLDWYVKDVDKTLRKIYKKWNSNLFYDYLKKFEINSNKKIKELSRGMKVKLMLAGALSHEAKILILDEPTSGLDPVARDELTDILLDYLKDESNSILFSTHITSDLEKIADYIVYIKDGMIKYNNLKDKILEDYLIVKGTEVNEKDKIIGLTSNELGFSGMIKFEDKEYFRNCSFEKITLDDFVVYMSKEEKKYE